MVAIVARAHLQTIADAVQVGLVIRALRLFVLKDASRKMDLPQSLSLPQKNGGALHSANLFALIDATMEARVPPLALAFVNAHTQFQAATFGCVQIWKLLEMGMLCVE